MESRWRWQRDVRVGRPAVTARASWILIVALAACGPREGANPGEVTTDAAPELPERFGFGIPAEEARIAAWDIDVRPDGVGLPAGSGTVEQGAGVYQGKCAVCHGPTGVEGPNNRLVGTEPWEDFPGSRTVGSYWPYATTLFDYLLRAMPQDAPGSLTADETYALVAWLLHQNEIIPAEAVMDATTLPAVEMPARDRFVPDDRLEANVVR